LLSFATTWMLVHLGPTAAELDGVIDALRLPEAMPPRPSWRSPLLIGAAVALVLVTCAGTALLLTRSKRRPVDDADVARLIEEIQANERRGGAAARDRAIAPLEDPNGEPQRAIEAPPSAAVPPDGGAAEVPVWARRPRVWTTPFPEGGRINPPLPPVKLLPEMLDPPGAVPDAGASANREQVDVESDPARR
jgi:hypothetical protein